MKCLRCGRETEEGASFCKECLKEAGKPLEESPYLSTQIVLPTRRPRPQTPSLPTASKKSKKSKRGARPVKSRKGLIASVCILSVFCLLLTGSCVWLLKDQIFGFDPSANNQRLLEEDNNRLNSALSDAQQALSDQTAAAETLRSENQALEKENGELLEDLNGDRIEQSEMDLSIRDLQESQQSLLAEVNKCRKRIQELEKLQKTSAEENEALTKEVQSLFSENASLQTTVDFINAHVVFINSGSKIYHRLSCPNFDRSRGWIALNLAEARHEGYLPCPDCQ